VCVSSYFFAFIREFNILCFDSILNGGYVLFKTVLTGGKQLVDKISLIVDKKKKVRTSKVGDKVRVPSPSNIKDFVTLPRNQGYKNKYSDEIWKRSNTNHSGSVSFIFPIHIY
jgi:hypothetical protein